MALKLGAENKRNVIIVAVLFVVVLVLAMRQLFSGDSTPPPTRAVTPPPALRQAPEAAALSTSGPSNARPAISVSKSGPAAQKLPGTGLDPALHLEKLAFSESIEYAGNGRNIFSADSAPVEIPEAMGPARIANQEPVGPVVPVIPTPPAIDLHYFGYTADKGGERKAFLLHGEDIFEASAGEIVDHRFKVVAVQAGSIQVTDLSYNNTQTLPLTAN